MAEGNANVKERLREIDDRVMKSLTPFQRSTVMHIAQLYKGGQRRVLVADEVGLGKTLIARGVISKIARLRSEDEKDDFVKVAYICSNASIAAQNISKLAIDGEIDMASPDESRLSMQHLKLAKERADERLMSRYIQITPLTPSTSFSIASGTGTMHERALILAVLAYDGRFARGTARYERLRRLMWSKRKDSNEANWDYWCSYTDNEVREASENDPQRTYPFDILAKAEVELEKAGRTTFGSLCAYLDKGEENQGKEGKMINDLRSAFAKVCVELLEPDFVIMDEFQRFRSLLSSDESETSILVQRFLQGGNARVLLLSATPFRMYSTSAELDSGSGFGDSYQEFLEVMDFLGGENEASHERFVDSWGTYVVSLRALAGKSSGVESARQAKGSAERVARGYMARTERQSTHELGTIADNQNHVYGDPNHPERPALQVTADDIQAYLRMRSLMQAAGIRRGLMSAEFIKSCPFPLSFMGDYKLFQELGKKADEQPSLISADKRADGGLLWLRKWDVNPYTVPKINNARYRALMDDLTGDEGVRPEQLLWIPPGKPYYRSSSTSPYAHAKNFSKMLIFSSWAMVPPALSTLISYEFERKNVRKLERITGKDFRYFKDASEDMGGKASEQALPYRRVRFDKEQHNAFLLLYPSRYLAGLVDVAKTATLDATLADVRRDVRRHIVEDLPKALGIELPKRGEAAQRSSIDWYVMAALKLDALYGHDVLGEILGPEGRKALNLGNAYGTETGILSSISSQAAEWDCMAELSRYPEDLVDVLVDAAIGSPAVCAMRTYGAYADNVPAWMGFQFGHAFVKRMNTASATLVVAAATEHANDVSSHWKNLLDYACEGNLQAVLDEYAYLQRPVDMGTRDTGLAESIHRAMVGSGAEPNLRNAETVHYVRVPKSKDSKKRIDDMRLRTNIASAFMDTRARTKADAVVSRSNLREAFNSPFRPFVLVSTSVGQEGLDFHKYCRRICHWNLPSNPIDLEQREGRVNRYQGLSVRQSIAARYGDMEFGKGPIWEQLFEVAETEELKRDGVVGASGLLPYWGVTEGASLVPVERYAYLYPFSRDVEQYESLIEQVYRYRMVIGQPDQEELLRVLGDRVDDGTLSEEELKDLYINLCPYVWERDETDE